MATDLRIRSVVATAPTSTGTQDYTVSGFGTPKAAIVFVTAATNNTGSKFANIQCSYAFTDGSSHYGLCWRSLDNSGSSNCSRAIFDDLVVGHPNSAASTFNATATFDSWITDGVRLNWTDASGVANHQVHVILIGGSDLDVDVGTVNLNSNGGTLLANPTTVNVGFRPSAILTLSMGTTNPATQTFANALVVQLGYAVAGDQRSFNMVHLNGVATSEPGIVLGQTMASTFTPAAGSVTLGVTAEITGFTSSGFTIASGGVSGTGPEVGYLALRLSNRHVALNVLSTPTATGVQSYTVGFEPEFVFLALTQAQGAWTNTGYSDGQGGMGGLGFMNPSEEFGVNWTEEDNQATTDSIQASKSSALLGYDHTNTLTFLGDWDSFDSDGFNVNFTTAPGTATKFLALSIEEQLITGTGAGSFRLPTATGAGTLTLAGTGAGTFPLAAGTGVGTLILTGTGTGLFPLALASGVGTQILTATGAGLFPLALATGAGTITLTGTGSGLFPLATGTGSGSVAGATVSGTGAGLFPLPLASGVGTPILSATGSGLFPLPQAVGSGTILLAGVGAGLFPLALASGAGTVSSPAVTGTGAGVFFLPLGTGAGTLILIGTGSGLFPLAVAFGTDSVPFGCPTELEGGYHLVTELEGSYLLVTELAGTYKLVSELEGDVC